MSTTTQKTKYPETRAQKDSKIVENEAINYGIIEDVAQLFIPIEDHHEFFVHYKTFAFDLIGHLVYELMHIEEALISEVVWAVIETEHNILLRGCGKKGLY